MLNKAEFRSEKATKKKGAASLKNFTEDDEAYYYARDLSKREKLDGLFPHSAVSNRPFIAPSSGIPSSIGKQSKEKFTKEIMTTNELATKNIRGKWLKSGSSKCERPFCNHNQLQGLPKSNKNVYAKNLKSFLAPGEINYARKGAYSGDRPGFAERDFASVLKNLPDSAKKLPNLERLYSAESLRAFSNAFSMLTNQHVEANEKCLNSSAQISMLKLDDKSKNESKPARQIFPKTLKATKSKQHADCYKHVGGKKLGSEVTRSKKHERKLAETGSLSFSDSDDYLDNLKLNELNELSEDELRELYETSTTELIKTSRRNYCPDQYHIDKESINDNLHFSKECSKICLKSEPKSNVHQKNSTICTRDSSRKLKKGKDEKQQNNAGTASETETHICKRLDQKSCEMETKKSNKFYPKTLEIETVMGFKHSERNKTEKTQLSSQNFYRQKLETEIVDFEHFNQERPEKARLKPLDQERPVPDMARYSQRKPCTEQLAGGCTLGSKSSIHFCQMIAKTLPSAKIIPFHKLSEILPETELAKVNENIDKNIQEKQFLPGLLEDTQLHIDRIKQQVLRKAKECLPNATFSKINQFLSSNQSEDCLELPSENSEVVHCTEPKRKISYEELKSVSSGHQKRSGRSSAASYHGGDGTRSRKYDRKMLTKSNSYYDHLYSVYGDNNKQRQQRGKLRRKYVSENRLNAKTNQLRSLKTMKRNATNENISLRYDRKLNRSVSSEDFLKVCHNCSENNVNCFYTSESHEVTDAPYKDEKRLANDFPDNKCKPSYNEVEQVFAGIDQTCNSCNHDCNNIFSYSYVDDHSSKESGLDCENYNNAFFENLGFEDFQQLDCENTKCLLNLHKNSDCIAATCNCNVSSSNSGCTCQRCCHSSAKAIEDNENLDDVRFDCNQKLALSCDSSDSDSIYKCNALYEGDGYSFNKSFSSYHTVLKTNKNSDNNHNHSYNNEPFHQCLSAGTKVCYCNNLYEAGDSSGVSYCNHSYKSFLRNKSLTTLLSPKKILDESIFQNSTRDKHLSNCNISFQERCEHFDSSLHIGGNDDPSYENKCLGFLDKSPDFHESNCQNSHSKPNFSIISAQEDNCFKKEYGQEPTNFNDKFEEGYPKSNGGKYYFGESPCQNCQVDHNMNDWRTNSYGSDDKYCLKFQRSCLPTVCVWDHFDQPIDQSEHWRGLYEPTEKEHDVLNSQHYLHLANLLLNSGLSESVTMNNFLEKPNCVPFIRICDLNDNSKIALSDKMDSKKWKSIGHSSIYFKKEKKNFISFCVSRMQRNSKLVRFSQKSIHASPISETDHKNNGLKTKSYRILSSKSNAPLRNSLRLKERVSKYRISKSRGEQICVYQSPMSAAALEFLRFKKNFGKKNGALDKITAFQIRNLLQEQSGSSVTERKLHFKSFTHPDILDHVPEVTPLSTTCLLLDHLNFFKLSINPCQKLWCTEMTYKSILELCKLVANSNIQLPQNLVFERIKRPFCNEEYNFCLSNDSKTTWQLYNLQGFGLNFCKITNYFPLDLEGRKLNFNVASLITLFVKSSHFQNDVTFLEIQTINLPFNIFKFNELEVILKFYSTANYPKTTNSYKLKLVSKREPSSNICNFNHIFKPFAMFFPITESSKVQSYPSLNFVLNAPTKMINSLSNEIIPYSHSNTSKFEVQNTSEQKLNLNKLKKNSVMEVSRKQSKLIKPKSKTNSDVERNNFQKKESVSHSFLTTIQREHRHIFDQEQDKNFYLKIIDCKKYGFVVSFCSAASVLKVSSSHEKNVTNLCKSYPSPNSTLSSSITSLSLRKAASHQTTVVHQNFALEPLEASFTKKNSNIAMNGSHKYPPLDIILTFFNPCDTVLCSPEPKNYDPLETKVSFFYLLCFLIKWHFKYYSQRQVKYETFVENPAKNKRKNKKLVDCVSQTDLSLTNPEHFDSFLLAFLENF